MKIGLLLDTTTNNVTPIRAIDIHIGNEPYTCIEDSNIKIQGLMSKFNDLLVPDKPTSFGIKKVIFNRPATIVLREDGTKTVVKCQKCDIYNPELGLTMCIAKKH